MKENFGTKDLQRAIKIIKIAEKEIKKLKAGRNDRGSNVVKKNGFIKNNIKSEELYRKKRYTAFIYSSNFFFKFMSSKIKESFEKTRIAGSIAAGALDEVNKIIKPGVTTSNWRVVLRIHQ